VKYLVLPSVRNVLNMWTHKFGFDLVTPEEHKVCFVVGVLLRSKGFGFDLVTPEEHKVCFVVGVLHRSRGWIKVKVDLKREQERQAGRHKRK